MAMSMVNYIEFKVLGTDGRWEIESLINGASISQSNEGWAPDIAGDWLITDEGDYTTSWAWSEETRDLAKRILEQIDAEMGVHNE